jgi:cytosine/adenosine deaminase-related metal-dependent hydrolase
MTGEDPEAADSDDGQRLVAGTILRGREFEPVEGRVVVEDGEIAAIEEERVESDDIVLPAFVNAHTHIGDSIAKEAGGGLSLEELVAPPDGLKHRLLRQASTEEKIAAMHRSLAFMADAGTAAHIEFREGDVDGVREIRAAGENVPVESVVLGRGSIDAMAAGDGYGASGANDADFDRERAATARADKLFGIHAGEVDSSDIDAAMDLDPEFLVHMVHPEPWHLDRLADAETPVVVCPRSNLVTDVGLSPLSELLERTTVALGTDNVFLNSPSMFREMEFTAKLFDVSATEVLRMATVAGADIADLNCGLVDPGRDAELLVLDGDSHNLTGTKDVVRAVVRRAGVDDIRTVVR